MAKVLPRRKPNSSPLVNKGMQAMADRYTAMAKAYAQPSTIKKTYLPIVTKPTRNIPLTDAERQMIYDKYFSGRGLTPNGRATPTVVQPPAVVKQEAVTEDDSQYAWGWPSYSGGSGGGSSGYTQTEEVPVTWSEFDSGVSNRPSWWKAMKPSAVNDATEFLASLNMLIPFLSPEDQKTVASNLYTQDATNFGHLNPENIQFMPTGGDMTTNTRRIFTDALRAQQAITALSKLAGAVGKKDEELGAGYRYLRSILNVGNQFGGNSAKGNAQTRRQYVDMMAALDPLIAQSKTEQLSPYQALVKMLTTPFFSGGQLMPVFKDANGQISFGAANKSWL